MGGGLGLIGMLGGWLGHDTQIMVYATIVSHRCSGSNLGS